MFSISTKSCVGCQEILLGVPELGFHRSEFIHDVLQFGIRQEVTQPIEEWKGVPVNQRMSTTFDQRQLCRGIFWQEAFVAETDQAVGKIGLSFFRVRQYTSSIRM